MSISNRSGRRRARGASAGRYHNVGLALLKEAGVQGWEFHDKLMGRASAKLRYVICPTPTTRYRLYVLAHECGHVALGHKGSKPSHRTEFEAERYAREALRRHGVAVPREATANAKTYVASRIDLAVRLGKAKRLDREAVKWTRGEHTEATKKVLRDGSVELVNFGRKKTRRHVR